jgi:hypothetical protein
VVANFPLQILPAQPIASLRIARKEQDVARCGQFDRQHETRVYLLSAIGRIVSNFFADFQFLLASSKTTR